MAKLNFKINIPVSILKEGERYVAYTPALDLSTSGKTYREVQKRFSEIVAIFIEEIAKAGTLNSVLSDLGWKKVKTSWVPPLVISQNLQTIEV